MHETDSHRAFLFCRGDACDGTKPYTGAKIPGTLVSFINGSIFNFQRVLYALSFIKSFPQIQIKPE
jgi:hypothetical protein